MLIADIYRNPTKGDFVSIGIAEVSTTKDGLDKINFYKLSSKLQAFGKMTYKQIGQIHEVLLKFGTYRPEQGRDGSNIMGVHTAYIEADMFANIENLTKFDNMEALSKSDKK